MTVRPAAQGYAIPVPARLATVLEQLGRIVVGKDTPLKLALSCLLARGHLLIEDIPADGETRPLPDPFFVIATQNPSEQIGAYPLPESQLDRFLMAIELGYPDPAGERELLISGDRRARISTLSPCADPATLLAWQREAAVVHVAPALLDYVQALLAASRGMGESGTQLSGIQRGLSPRAGLLLVAAARAWALLAGRP